MHPKTTLLLISASLAGACGHSRPPPPTATAPTVIAFQEPALIEVDRSPGAREFAAAAEAFRAGRLSEAHALLDAIASRALPAPMHVRALIERGIVALEEGALDVATASLQDALTAWGAAEAQERMPQEHVAAAHYYLGEVERVRGERAKLPLDAGPTSLTIALEARSDRLLAAQGHYLKAIQSGDVRWGLAAGARIGELYERLYADLAEAPLPAELDEAERQAYRTALHDHLQELLVKAAQAYQETLSAAQHTGNAELVPRLREALDRIQRLVREAPSTPAPRAGATP